MPTPTPTPRGNDRSARERAIRLFSAETRFPAHVLIPWLIEIRPVYWRLVMDVAARRRIDITETLRAEIPTAHWSLPELSALV